MTLIGLLTAIANAIRGKKGTSAPIQAEDFPDEITSIQTGGTYQTKTVIPTTTSQTILPDSGYDALSQVEVNAVTSAIDANIQAENIKKDVSILNVTGTYEGTTSIPVESKGVDFIDYDGTLLYSYTPTEIQSLTQLPTGPTHTGLTFEGWNWTLSELQAHNGYATVGALYHTTSGLSEFDVELTIVTGKQITFNMDGNKNWGDGTSDNLTTHTYENYGKYTITCDGTVIKAGTSSLGGMFRQDSSNINGYWCKAIRLSNSVVEIGQYSLKHCNSLEKISFSQSLENIGQRAFEYSRALRCAIIPRNITTIPTYCFRECYSIAKISLPHTINTINGQAFYNCFLLSSYMSLGNITSIPSSVFYENRLMKIFDFRDATQVVTLENTNAFSGLTPVYIFIVPDSLYDDWKAANNWNFSTIAAQIYKASEV